MATDRFSKMLRPPRCPAVSRVTPSRDGDSRVLPDLLGQIPEDGQIGTVTADGAYDTRALSELERRGWVRREIDDQDRRIAHASLTHRGKRALDTIRPEMEAATDALLAPLSPGERATVEEGLAVLERLFKHP